MLLVGLVLASSLLLSSEANAGRYTAKYDGLIQSSVSKWWPRHVHWAWWKSQLYQESLLKPDAVSPVGAAGLAQFMPGTWKEISVQLGYGGLSPHLAKPAVYAGAYYMRKLARGWKSPRPEIDRWDLARASYNAGFGNLLKAQKKCGGVAGFEEIMSCLPQITGRHSRETITYVKRIHRWFGELRRCRRC